MTDTPSDCLTYHVLLHRLKLQTDTTTRDDTASKTVKGEGLTCEDKTPLVERVPQVDEFVPVTHSQAR